MNYLLITTALFFLFTTGCNNAADNKETVVKTHADSLLDGVMEGHDEAMVKTNKVSAALKKVQQALDSIDKLPQKGKQVSAVFKMKLDSLSAQLQYAQSGMDKWMEEFSMDSAKNDLERRSRYLESEKEKVYKIKDVMVSALQKADSLLNK